MLSQILPTDPQKTFFSPLSPKLSLALRSKTLPHYIHTFNFIFFLTFTYHFARMVINEFHAKIRIGVTEQLLAMQNHPAVALVKDVILPTLCFHRVDAKVPVFREPILVLGSLSNASPSLLKVPKCEIFDLFDFNDFYVIKSL